MCFSEIAHYKLPKALLAITLRQKNLIPDLRKAALPWNICEEKKSKPKD